MRDIDGGNAQALLQPLEFVAHAFAQGGIEVAEGFVQQQQLRLAHDGAGQGDALLLAAGKLGG